MTMKLRVLGCSGGIGGRHLRTTSMLLDHDILIDAGTGVADLSIAELAVIDHVFLTHSHLDHIASLPLMIDTVADRRTRPLTVYSTPSVLTILRNHIFNWAIWPDFSEVPSPESPFLRYQNVAIGGNDCHRRAENYRSPGRTHGAGRRLLSGLRRSQPGVFRRYRCMRPVLAHG